MIILRCVFQKLCVVAKIVHPLVYVSQIYGTRFSKTIALNAIRDEKINMQNFIKVCWCTISVKTGLCITSLPEANTTFTKRYWHCLMTGQVRAVRLEYTGCCKWLIKN